MYLEYFCLSPSHLMRNTLRNLSTVKVSYRIHKILRNQREEINLRLANQLLQFSELIKESADSLAISNPCAFMISDTHSFTFPKLGESDSKCQSYFLD